MSALQVSLFVLAAFAAGAVFGLLLWKLLVKQRLAALLDQEKARLAAAQLTVVADIEAKAEDQFKRQRQSLEEGLARDREAVRRERAEAAETEERLKRREAKLTTREDGIATREQTLDRKLESLDQRDGKLRAREEAFEAREQGLVARSAQLDQREQGIDQRLAEVAGLTAEQAREELLKRLDAALVAEQSERIARVEKETSARSRELGIEIIDRAIQRYAAEHTAETTITKVTFADEDMKGRIIGKEGRNIKAFEQATGVDLIIDETPGTITISCFSGLRREMARRTLELLIADGRIHPGRIEELMIKVQQDLDREVLKLGEDAAFTCEVSGLHPQLLRLLGKLRYRTSYGQNVLQHSQEVAFLTGAMAADLGLEAKIGRRCGLLHDIGKAVDHEQEGSHPQLGYEALKRFGESELVANAALAHHEGHDAATAYTVLTAAADAISAARPGARSKNLEGYLKRLEQIEDLACTYRGVQKAYAIQAGRELRVIISGRDVTDQELPKLAHDIARRIEDEVSYPGEVKVTLIREMRQTAVAK